MGAHTAERAARRSSTSTDAGFALRRFVEETIRSESVAPSSPIVSLHSDRSPTHTPALGMLDPVQDQPQPVEPVHSEPIASPSPVASVHSSQSLMLNSAIDMWGPEQDRRTEEDEAKRQTPKNTLVTSGAKEVSTPGDMLLVIRE